MNHIILTEEQARVVSQTTDSVELRDPQGRTIALVKAMNPLLMEAILECKRRHASSEPRIPSADVQAHLQKLDEIRKREGMDREKMHDLLRRMRAGEAVSASRSIGSPRLRMPWRMSGSMPPIPRR
jgi:hypothetical protein